MTVALSTDFVGALTVSGSYSIHYDAKIDPNCNVFRCGPQSPSQDINGNYVAYVLWDNTKDQPTVVYIKRT